MKGQTCRFCRTELKQTFVDLGMSPLSNSYVRSENLQRKENFYPLHAYVCESCFLVQLEEFETPEEIFGDYAYFSSFSDSWLDHAKRYADMVINNFNLNETSLVVEIASNDGYLLQYFKEGEVPVLGIEPARNVAKVAQSKGITTVVDFFGKRLAQELTSQNQQADLIIGNNVLAHVPDINNFISGMKLLLKERGLITMEFPHLLKLMEQNQFDTIYHEHFSYFSLFTVDKVFKAHGLAIFDVEELPTHGGSLRIYAGHVDDESKLLSTRKLNLLEREEVAGLNNIETYLTFSEKVKEVKRNVLDFLIKVKREGKVVIGYGAPAKGNTLLNYCGIRSDFLDYTVDRSPYKQGLYLPGTHIPIKDPEVIKDTKPDFVFILPWNIKEEILEKISFIREWGGKFVIPIPEVKVT